MEKIAAWHNADYINDIPKMQAYVSEQSCNMYNGLLLKVITNALGDVELNEASYKRFRLDIHPTKHEIYFDDKLIGHIPMGMNVGYEHDDFERNKFTMALSFIPYIP